jgi:hypothetical protein
MYFMFVGGGHHVFVFRRGMLTIPVDLFPAMYLCVNKQVVNFLSAELARRTNTSCMISSLIGMDLL